MNLSAVRCAIRSPALLDEQPAKPSCAASCMHRIDRPANAWRTTLDNARTIADLGTGNSLPATTEARARPQRAESP